MKRILSCLLISLLGLTPFSQAGMMDSPASGIYGKSLGAGVQRSQGQTTLQKLSAMGGLTFFKDYQTSPATLNADYSLGSPTATFTATRQATNSTYVDDDGLIKVSDTAVNRKNNYYDATGFHARSGVLLEAGGTNLVKDSYFADGTTTYWRVLTGAPTISNSSTFSNPYLSGTVLKVVGATNEGVQTAIASKVSLTAGVTYTAQALIRGTGKIKIQVAGTATSETSEITLANDKWYLHTLSFSAGATETYNVAFKNTESTTLYIAITQLETGSTATSFIPTTTAAVARQTDYPSTYVDANGVIQVNATNNTPRYQGGYYDATGFHQGNKGLMAEGAITNLIPKSSTIDDATWTETNTVAANADAGSTTPFGDATSPSLTASADNGTLLLTTNVTAQTYSVWLKRKTGTGAVSISANSGAGYTEVTLTSDWRRFSITAASAAQKCGIKIATDTDAVYVWGNQFEASPYMTSYIPTTTAAMSRTAEVLKYAITGNRTAATESVFLKFSQEFTSNTTAGDKFLLDTDTKQRRVSIQANGTLTYWPNLTDSSGASMGSANTSAFTSYVASMIAYGETAGTNGEVYIDAVSKGTTTTNYTAPSWGTYFYVGAQNNSDPSNGHKGVISSIAIFSDAKSATDVSAITGVLNA